MPVNTLQASTLPPPHLYYDRQLGIEAAKILPGGYCVTDRNMVLATVLGSCVSACIRDPKMGIGGMNHFMLPESASTDTASDPLAASARYGVHAMELLLNELSKAGAHRSALEAKVFGGGAVVAGMTSSDVGHRNATVVLDFLRIEGIAVAAQDLEDIYPRKLHYFPRSGRVMVKKLRDSHNDTIGAREREYRARLSVKAPANDVELFV